MGLLMGKTGPNFNRVDALVHTGKNSFWHIDPLLFIISQLNFTVRFIIKGYIL